jgi:glucose-6-phosphate 1-dehydrogenase
MIETSTTHTQEVTASALPNDEPSGTSCQIVSSTRMSPCTIVIFGASGDLTFRKIIPALYTLFLNNGLPSPINIVGCSRTPFSSGEFREKLRLALETAGRNDLGRWPEFAANLYYSTLAYDSLPAYALLGDFLQNLARKTGTGKNYLFYLAVPPTLYEVIGNHLGTAGFSSENQSGGWVRIVVEKPFGRDLKTARQLDTILHRSFQEEQIFRIDHYLAKETVQNILMLRFANTIFEPIWNRSFIDYVGIVTSEQLGVENRAGYYEQSGVLRDMFQNHLMQLLALTAIEPPSHFEADLVQDEKVKIFRALKPLTEVPPKDNLILGQYSAGIIDGKPVPAYRDEPGVSPRSLTPTFAMMRLFIDNWRWRGVPFYLVSGKRLREKKTQIVVQFKKVPHSMFRNVIDENILANRLVLGIYPEERISLTFQTKSPGTRECLRPVMMDYRYYDDVQGPAVDAYAKVLQDCLVGDHMLFWRQDGIELSWSYLTPIISQCENCSDRETNLQFYQAGSLGPDAAQDWMRLIMQG